MNIRLAGPEDFMQLGELMQQLNPGDPPFDEKNLEVFDQITANPHFILLVAEKAGNLIASAYLNVIPNLSRGGRPYAVAENLVVDLKHRKQGVGRAMMEKLIEIAWEVDCYKLMLLTGRKNKGVHAFYQKLGFSGDAKQAYILRAGDSPPGHD